ncbi:MAG TPA: hypothetical protein VF194_01655 [Ferrovibrio sp.]|uniref:hypothetical protein n=1 Tax=Ferrovibrio sp. TaxID=1917215 RepID=UPI002ED04B59
MNNLGQVLSFWVMGAIVTILGLLGLVLAADARDGGMLWFGLALAVFAVIYDFFAIHVTHKQP